MNKAVFWNRRSGGDRRHRAPVRSMDALHDERRTGDRRLYSDNHYLLVVGDSGLDRFTVLVALPLLVMALLGGLLVIT